jgi:hypothetical protein
MEGHDIMGMTRSLAICKNGSPAAYFGVGWPVEEWVNQSLSENLQV